MKKKKHGTKIEKGETPMRELLPPAAMSDAIRDQSRTLHQGADSAIKLASRCGLWYVAYADLWSEVQDVRRENERLRRDLAEMAACMSELQEVDSGL